MFFHLNQSTYRKIQENSLQRLYKEDAELALKLKMTPAFAFVPMDDDAGVFRELPEILPPVGRRIDDYLKDALMCENSSRVYDDNQLNAHAIGMWSYYA